MTVEQQALNALKYLALLHPDLFNGSDNDLRSCADVVGDLCNTVALPGNEDLAAALKEASGAS